MWQDFSAWPKLSRKPKGRWDNPPMTLPFPHAHPSALRGGGLLGAGKNSSQTLHTAVMSFQIDRCNQLSCFRLG